VELRPSVVNVAFRGDLFRPAVKPDQAKPGGCGHLESSSNGLLRESMDGGVAEEQGTGLRHPNQAAVAQSPLPGGHALRGHAGQPGGSLKGDLVILSNDMVRRRRPEPQMPGQHLIDLLEGERRIEKRPVARLKRVGAGRGPGLARCP